MSTSRRSRSLLRAPWEEITASRPDERLFVLLDDEAMPVGLALVRHLGDTSMSFVRYFVVDEQRRGGGHGSALLKALVDHLREAGRSMLLLDVEDPDGRPDDSPERRDDLRRIEFYRRQGVDLLAVRDYAPPDHGQEGEEPALLLMGASLRRILQRRPWARPRAGWCSPARRGHRRVPRPLRARPRPSGRAGDAAGIGFVARDPQPDRHHRGRLTRRGRPALRPRAVQASAGGNHPLGRRPPERRGRRPAARRNGTPRR